MIVAVSDARALSFLPAGVVVPPPRASAGGGIERRNIAGFCEQAGPAGVAGLHRGERLVRLFEASLRTVGTFSFLLCYLFFFGGEGGSKILAMPSSGGLCWFLLGWYCRGGGGLVRII